MTDQIDLRNIYTLFHPTTERSFFSAAHRTFSKIDHILGHKASLNQNQKIEIISCILSYHKEWNYKLTKKNHRK